MLESEFSGNLVEVCPTGVFTDKTFARHYTRKWDLQTAPSVCVALRPRLQHHPGERYGELRRVRDRFNREVNGYSSATAAASATSSSTPSADPPAAHGGRPGGGRGGAVAARAATDAGAAARRCGGAIGIGSPRASLEANFALRHAGRARALLRGHVGRRAAAGATSARDPPRGAVAHAARSATSSSRRGARPGRGRHQHRAACWPCAAPGRPEQPPRRRRTSCEIRRWNDAAVREAVQEPQGPLFMATPRATQARRRRAPRPTAAHPTTSRASGFAVAHAVDAAAPEVPGLPAELASWRRRSPTRCAAAERPLVVAGAEPRQRGGHAGRRQRGVGAAPRGHAVRALPRRARVQQLWAWPCSAAAPLAEAFARRREGEADVVIVLENDLYRRAPAAAVDALLARRACGRARPPRERHHRRAPDSCCPAGDLRRGDGTLVNNEGRAQRFFQVFVPADGRSRRAGAGCATWRRPAGHSPRRRLDAAWTMSTRRSPRRSPPCAAQPGRRRRRRRTSAIGTASRIPAPAAPLQRPHRHARANVGPCTSPSRRDDPDSPLAFSMEGYEGSAARADHALLLGAGLELDPGDQQVPGGGGRPAPGRGPGVRLIEPARERRPALLRRAPRPRSRRRRRRVAGRPGAPHLRLRGAERARARDRRAGRRGRTWA